MSTNHCARTYFLWVRACAPHLWFVHLPQLTLFTSPTTPSTPRHVCSIQFGTLEILQSPDKFIGNRKTQINIYVYIYFAHHLRGKWQSYMSFGSSVLYPSFLSSSSIPPNRPIPSLSLFSFEFPWIPSLLIFLSFDQSIHRLIDPLIHPSIHPSIIQSIYPLIDLSINPSINALIDRSINPPNHPSIDTMFNSSIHQSYHPSIHQSVDPSIHRSIHWSINRSIGQSIDPSIHRSFYRSIHPSLNRSIHWSFYPS